MQTPCSSEGNTDLILPGAEPALCCSENLKSQMTQYFSSAVVKVSPSLLGIRVRNGRQVETKQFRDGL